MYFLECDCCHDMCTWVGSNPCRKLSLLGIAHPVDGSLFQVQGVYRRTTLTRGRVLEEIRIVALVFSLYSIKTIILIYFLVKSIVKTFELLLYG